MTLSSEICFKILSQNRKGCYGKLGWQNLRNRNLGVVDGCLIHSYLFQICLKLFMNKHDRGLVRILSTQMIELELKY